VNVEVWIRIVREGRGKVTAFYAITTAGEGVTFQASRPVGWTDILDVAV
jgi:hypothetical protein